MPSLTPLHETYCRWDSTPPNQADVIEGLAQLVTVNLLGVHDVIQLIHQEILLKSLGFDQEQSNHILARPFVQHLFRQGYQFAQNSGQYVIAPTLRHLNFKFPKLQQKILNSTLCSMVSILNGVMGNYLFQQQNPLALPMVLYDHYGQLLQGEVAGRVIILVHGLCMSHLSWSNGNYTGVGEKLLAQRDRNTILYLDYNSGRRISSNGQSLAWLIEDLIQRNPRILSIDLIGHSMGGLVCRSALFYGKQHVMQWINLVENLVCIGSPHHGAALERLGFMLQDQLGRLPVLNRLGQLTQIRSDGILDLRFGSVRDDDWEYLSIRTGTLDDLRKPAPLPSRINTFLIAGTIEQKPQQSRTLEMIGDYLVRVPSALGEHPDAKYQLKVPEAHKAIFYGLNHMEIQYHPAVAEQIAKWLYPQPIQQHEKIEEVIPSLRHFYQHELNDLKGIVET